MNEDNIKWLAKNSEELSDNELIDWLYTECKSDQTGIILDHIRLLSENMMIGYDDKDVYVMSVIDDDNCEVIKITKNSNQ